MSGLGLTVVRVPWNGRQDTVATVLTAVACGDPALAQTLHVQEGNPRRAYSVACRPDQQALDVVCGTDDLVRAICRAPGARFVTRVSYEELLAPPDDPARSVRLGFEAPTKFRVAGYDHVLPDQFHVFTSLLDRWSALDWPALPEVRFKRIPVWIEQIEFRSMLKGKMPARGFLGTVRFETLPQEGDGRLTLHTLARFGAFMGVGTGTSYGLGRCRALGEHETYSRGRLLTPWDEGEPERWEPKPPTAAAPVSAAKTGGEGPVFVTPHAIQQFQTRVPGAADLSFEEARAALLEACAHPVHVTVRGSTHVYSLPGGFHGVVTVDPRKREGPLPVLMTVEIPGQEDAAVVAAPGSEEAVWSPVAA